MERWPRRLPFEALLEPAGRFCSMHSACALVNSSCPQHAVAPSCQISDSRRTNLLLLTLYTAYCDLPGCSAPPARLRPLPLAAWGSRRPSKQGSWHEWNRIDQDGRPDGEGAGAQGGPGSSLACSNSS